MSKDYIIGKSTEQRCDDHLQECRGQSGRVQLWIDYNNRRIDHLSNFVEERMARIDRLMKKGG